MQTNEVCEIDLNPEELNRYARHLSLPEIGMKGQKQLKASSVLCIGCGGLGSPVLLYLAAVGVGRIGVIDFDLVDNSNLQRQIIHSVASVGQPKTNSARTRIHEINPNCKVETFHTQLTRENALDLLNNFDIICDCTDNFPARYLINDACVILGKPNIYGSIAGFEGQVSVFNLNTESPNYRDLVPEPPPAGLLPTCSEGGVLGVLPGLIGLVQATEVIKIITKVGDTLSGRLLVFNALTMRFKELSLKKCSHRQPIQRLINYDEYCADNVNNLDKDSSIESISVNNLKEMLTRNRDEILLLDVRNQYEHERISIQNSTLVTLENIENGNAIEDIRRMMKGRKLYVHCKSGIRSIKAIKILQQHNISGVNVSGGIDAWIKENSQE